MVHRGHDTAEIDTVLDAFANTLSAPTAENGKAGHMVTRASAHGSHHANGDVADTSPGSAGRSATTAEEEAQLEQLAIAKNRLASEARHSAACDRVPSEIRYDERLVSPPVVAHP